MTDDFPNLFDEPTIPLPAERIPTRVFMGWEKQLLTSAVKHITKDHSEGAIDLKHQLIIVPTRLAGRRLREALAVKAHDMGTAVIAPKVITASALCSKDFLAPLQTQFADDITILTTWIDALSSAKLRDYSALFPIPPEHQHFHWALNTANSFLQLQHLLREQQLSFQDLATRVKNTEYEPARWECLARLEALWRKKLKHLGYNDPQELITQHAKTIDTPWDHIILIGTSDLPTVAKNILQSFTKDCLYETLVFAPDDFADYFDAWGVPNKKWLNETLQIPEAAERIHSVDLPSTQANHILRLLSQSETPSIAIGVLDSELISYTKEALASASLSSFDPAGESISKSSAVYFLKILQRFLKNKSLADLHQLICITNKKAEWINTIDKIRNVSIAQTLEDFIQDNFVTQFQDIKHWASSIASPFEELPFDQALKQVTEALFISDDAITQDAFFSAILLRIHETSSSIQQSSLISTWGIDDRFTLLIHTLSQEKEYGNPQVYDLLLQGWLELPWEQSEALIIAGFNEGNIPEIHSAHSYVPEKLRNFLALSDNQSRTSRDAFHLQSLIRSKKRVDIILGRNNANNDPLRPSSLLLKCKSEELISRIEQLFPESESPQKVPAWHAGWKLKVPEPPTDHKLYREVSVSTFKDYLNCPFRFYLKRILKMEPRNELTKEVDNRTFGNICHEVLENYGKSAIRYSIDKKEIIQFFSADLERIIKRDYGTKLTIPMQLQKSSIENRLRWWAAIEAEQRARWEIIEVEKDIEIILNDTLVKGRVDRIEQNKALQTIRVIDYKTGKSQNPRDAHLKKINNTKFLESADTESYRWYSEIREKETKGKKAAVATTYYEWQNLQLPLYVLALREMYPNDAIVSAYANLSDKAESIQLIEWGDIDDHLLTTAKSSAEQIIERIRNKVFWPPKEKVKYDDFAPLFFDDIDATVDATLITSSQQ